MRALLNHLLQQVPEAAAIANEFLHPKPEPDEDLQPGWCRCKKCIEMPTPQEKLCCRKGQGLCITTEFRGYISRFIISRESLELVIRSRNDYYGFRDQPENINLRYAAYRQYTLWRWAKLGKHRREVIPSCVVNLIRTTFPDDNYTGFKPALGF